MPSPHSHPDLCKTEAPLHNHKETHTLTHEKNYERKKRNDSP